MEAEKDYFMRELRRVGRALASPTPVYMFGGGVMALRLMKARTKDLDLVVLSNAAADRLVGAFESCGYLQRQRLAGAYRRMNASAVLDNPEGFRIDLFTNVICRALEFGESMQARSTPVEDDTGLLEVRLTAPEDLFVLKAVTDRPRDVADMATISRQGLDWGVIQAEMVRQRKTGGKFFMPIFIQSLEELVRDHGVRVPILPEMLEELEHDLDEIEAMNEKAEQKRGAKAKK